MARRTLNIPFDTGEHNIAAATTTESAINLLSFISDVGLDTRPGMTIVRIRGYCAIWSIVDGVKTPIRVALYMTPEGGTASPRTLVSNILNVMWRLDTITSGDTVETAAGVFADRADIYPVETRGMRKVARAGEELRMLLRNDGGSGVVVRVLGTVRLMLE